MFFGDISFFYLEPVRTWSKVSWSGDQSIAEMISLMLACEQFCELTFVEISAPLNLFQKQNTFRHSGDPERFVSILYSMLKFQTPISYDMVQFTSISLLKSATIPMICVRLKKGQNCKF